MRKLLVMVGLTVFLMGGVSFADPIFRNVRVHIDIGRPTYSQGYPAYGYPVYYPGYDPGNYAARDRDWEARRHWMHERRNHEGRDRGGKWQDHGYQEGERGRSRDRD